MVRSKEILMETMSAIAKTNYLDIKIEQMKGKLAVHEGDYLNADGDDYGYANGESDVAEGEIIQIPTKRFEEKFIRRRSFLFGAVLGYAICVLVNKK